MVGVSSQVETGGVDLHHQQSSRGRMLETNLVCHRCGYIARSPAEDRCERCELVLVAAQEHAKAPRDAFLGVTLGGKYPILGIIGAGGMGAVYRSVQPLVERPVAIKVILPSTGFDAEESRKRFVREARTIALLDHPAIVRLLDFGAEPDGTLYMVQEFVQGQTLQRLYRKGSLTLQQFRQVALGVLDALDEAHCQNVVHRDLKPENIMVLADERDPERGPRVKVLDFGLVKMLGDTSSRLTRTGLVSGTPHYMSPEQATAKPLDHRTDLYSMGVLLYEGVAGYPPFQSDNPIALITLRLIQNPPPLPALPHVVPGLNELLQRALARNPDCRFTSAREMARALAGLDLGAAADLPLPAVLPFGAGGVVPDRAGPDSEQQEADALKLLSGELASQAAAAAGQPRSAPGSGSRSGPRETPIDGDSQQPGLPSHTAPSAVALPSVETEPPSTAAGGPATGVMPPDDAPTRQVPSVRQAAAEVEPLSPLTVAAHELSADAPTQIAPRPVAKKRAAWTIAAAIGLVALLVAGAGILLLGRPAAREAAESPVVQAPQLLPASGEGATGEPGAAPLAGPSPGRTPAAASELPPAPEQEPAAPAPAARALHRITSTPSGVSVQDAAGKKLGKTPLVLELPVVPGQQARYRLSVAGRQPATLVLPLDAGEHRAAAALAPLPRRVEEIPDL